MVRGRQTSDAVSFDVNPSSRQILADLTLHGVAFDLIGAGARIHQAGCLGCIGMGQAPASGRNSLRTFPRNFPGRSGTSEDSVWLCSPETAAAAALTGRITDPRELAGKLGIDHPGDPTPDRTSVNTDMFVAPLPPDEAASVGLVKGPNIVSLPDFDPLPDEIRGQVLLKLGDNISTDEISPAGARALPFRSNVPKLAEFTFAGVDEQYAARAAELDGPHLVVAGDNYGQGSSREHAAITPRFLRLRVVLAKSFARIHWQNLANFGIVALEFTDPADYDHIGRGDVLVLAGIPEQLTHGTEVIVHNETQDREHVLKHRLSGRQLDAVLAGGVIPRLRAEPSLSPSYMTRRS
jgi:aconitate hydratase